MAIDWSAERSRLREWYAVLLPPEGAEMIRYAMWPSLVAMIEGCWPGVESTEHWIPVEFAPSWLHVKYEQFKPLLRGQNLVGAVVIRRSPA